MALYSKKQIAELCSMPTNKLAVYIQRGKLVVNDGMINDANDINALFISKYSGKTEKVQTQAPPPPPTNETGPMNLVQLERQKKIADLKKVEVDTRIAKLREEKLMGQNIPTDLVRGVISQLSKSFVSKFKDGSENLIISIAKRYGLNNEDVSKLRGELILIINEAIKSSISDGKRSIGNIVNTYSGSRGVGEHD